MRFQRLSVWRKLVAVAVLCCAGACGERQPLDPARVEIGIRLRTDAGASAGRNQVLITRVDDPQDVRQASVDGSSDITVTGAGTFLIRVVPRAGFVWSETLRATVTVSSGERIAVTFTLYREGQSTDYLPPWVDRGQ